MKPTIYALCGIFGPRRIRKLNTISIFLDTLETKYVRISSDDIRDELYKQGKDFSTLNSLLKQKIHEALKDGFSVLLDSDNSGFKKTAWLYGNFGAIASIDKVKIEQTAEYLYVCMERISESAASESLPWYFQNHRGPEWQRYAAGPERGIAVARAEISRHLQNYKPDKDRNLVYKNFL